MDTLKDKIEALVERSNELQNRKQLKRAPIIFSSVNNIFVELVNFLGITLPNVNARDMILEKLVSLNIKFTQSGRQTDIVYSLTEIGGSSTLGVASRMVLHSLASDLSSTGSLLSTIILNQGAQSYAKWNGQDLFDTVGLNNLTFSVRYWE